MKLQNKYVKVFSKEKADIFINNGYTFLYEQNGVYYFLNNEAITAKFSNNDILKDVKFSTTVNF